MNNLLQMFNDFMNNLDLRTVHSLCFTAGAILLFMSLVGRIGEPSRDVTFRRITLILAIIFLAIDLFALGYTKLPGYKEKAPDVDYVDNNGIFGTGNGGIGKATPVMPLATYEDPETGEVKSISDKPGVYFAGPSDQLVSQEEPRTDAPIIPNMEPNDDPDPGPQEQPTTHTPLN